MLFKKTLKIYLLYLILFAPNCAYRNRSTKDFSYIGYINLM